MPTQETYTHATFYRCALQVNLYDYESIFRHRDHGLSEEAYNDALADQFADRDISVVGIADHRCPSHLVNLRDRLHKEGITVFPGFEISSAEKIHMVCLYPADTELEVLLGYLGALVDPKRPSDPSELSCLEIARKVFEKRGFWYAAHMTSNNGLIRLNQDGGGYPNIWTNCDLVLAGQISGNVGDITKNNEKSIIENRDPHYRRERPLALLNARDISRPEQVELPGVYTYVKMSSPNLNTIVGGRGTGKSTLIESLRFALDVEPSDDVAETHASIIEENLSKHGTEVVLTLSSFHQNGKRFQIRRTYGESPAVYDDQGEKTRFRPRDVLPSIEIYSQNELLALVRRTNIQPSSRLLRRFLGPEESIDLNSVNGSLSQNRRRIDELERDRASLDDQLSGLPSLESSASSYAGLGLDEELRRVDKRQQLIASGDEASSSVVRAEEVIENAIAEMSALGIVAEEDADPLATELREVVLSLRTNVLSQLEESRRSISEAKGNIGDIRSRLSTQTELEEASFVERLSDMPSHSGKGPLELARNTNAYRKKSRSCARSYQIVSVLKRIS